MEIIRPSREQAACGLRAMKTICQADGEFEDLERELLGSIQEHILDTDYDLDELSEISPRELAGHFSDAQLCAQLVNGMTVVSLSNGEQTKEKADKVHAYAEALGVESHLVRDMKLLADEHLTVFRLDLMRRTDIAMLGKRFAKDKSVMELLKAAASATGLGFDLEEARRFHVLGLLPAGSVGRTYWEFIRRNGFSFPGEPRAAPEIIMRHDLNHVLTGYSTSPSEEMKVGAFQAGIMRHDPFAMMVSILCQFHVGVRIAPVTGAQTGHFQPGPFISAFVRGLGAKVPTFDPDWDPFSVMERPLSEIREEFGIAEA